MIGMEAASSDQSKAGGSKVLWYFDQLFCHSSHRAMNGTDLVLVMGHLEGRIG